MSASGGRWRIALLLLTLAALLAGALALQLASGGIRVRSLAPDVLAASVGPLGALIAAKRPGLRFAPLMLVVSLGFGVGSLAAGALDFGAAHPIPRLAAQAAFATVSATQVLIAGWALFILWFPDGRFSHRGWRRFFVASVVVSATVAVLVWLLGSPDRIFEFYSHTAVPPGAAGPLAGSWSTATQMSPPVLLLFPLIALVALVQRYRRGDAVLREQVRWFLWGGGVTVVGQFLSIFLYDQHGALSDASLALNIVTQPVPMVAATVAILRYRLWEIDLVISRALVHGVVWAVLSALFIVPALAAGLLVGGGGAGAAVAIALLVTVVFHPARRWLDTTAERLVYRHRARPYVLLSGFWETVRAADLDRIGPLVANAVRSCLHVEWAGVWLYLPSPTGGRLRPLGVTGGSGGDGAAVSASTVEQLYAALVLPLDELPTGELGGLWPAPPEAVVSLVASDELVGLLASGGRRGDRLRAPDFELLELLARECAMRLRNLRLEAELRERLTFIEAQAAELTRSRQRLVTAQDSERRRIERNLHDGVQQQLVTLAARLHRAAADSPQLAGLAAEAEHAVFALQELGRGIYPSVLADQGLPAALRTQAARLPASVQLRVDDDLLDQRLEREVEAALYFVALEALTNACKHAPDASVSVWLR
ncbi:MAG TPA: histidine kinase, partial [Mycobacteriales bacterium]|nr:histidine kinase [Mycobacteriales bacterium]